jgi:hypothetical protein
MDDAFSSTSTFGQSQPSPGLSRAGCLAILHELQPSASFPVAFDPSEYFCNICTNTVHIGSAGISGVECPACNAFLGGDGDDELKDHLRQCIMSYFPALMIASTSWDGTLPLRVPLKFVIHPDWFGCPTRVRGLFKPITSPKHWRDPTSFLLCVSRLLSSSASLTFLIMTLYAGSPFDISVFIRLCADPTPADGCRQNINDLLYILASALSGASSSVMLKKITV